MGQSLPFRAQIVSDRDKANHPDESPGIRVEHERADFDLAHPRRERGEVANAGDEVAEEQRPFAVALKPDLHLRQMPADPAVQWPIAFERVDGAGAAQQVAQRDAAEAAGERREDCGVELQLSAMHGDPGEHEDRLVGNPRAHDPERQQPEDAKYP